jgi:hypothetical protein
MSSSRRLLVPIASAASVLVIVAGAVFVARRDGGGDDVGSPRLPALAINSGGGSAAAMAAGTADSKIAAPAGGAQKVEIKGQLPAATDALIPAYKLERRTLTRADVDALAAALGLKGSPQQQGAGWVLSDSGRVLSVDASPLLDWRMMPGEISCVSAGSSGSSVGSTGGGGGIAVDPGTVPAPETVVDPAKDAPAATLVAPVPPVNATASAPAAVNPPGPKALATKPVTEDPATTPNAPDCSVSSGVVSSGTACAVPDGAKPLVACEAPETKPAASDAVAREAALSLLGQLDVDTKGAAVRIDPAYNGIRHVSVIRRIDGLLAVGWQSDVEVDVKGAIASASGALAKPVLAGKYPMLPPGEAAPQLANTRVMAMLCVQKPGVEGCAPPPPIVVTGAEAGLSLTYPNDWEKGDAYLLPAWLYDIQGDPNPAPVVAVPQQFRGDVVPNDPNDLVRKGVPEPAPLPPVDAPATPN